MFVQGILLTENDLPGLDELARAAERCLIARDRQLVPSLSSSRASLKAIEEGDSQRVQCYICKDEGHKSF